MSPDIPSLEDLVHAICEGTPIDWDALEQVGSETFRSQVAALRVVAGIAEVHRPQATTATSPTTPSDAPQRWGHLDVLGHIASGAFGDVYRAWDPQLDREVALKLLRRAPDADAHADEVVQEGRLLARLRHPHIVSVYGAARIEGQVGLWMEYLRGRTLAEAVAKEGALPIRKVAEVGAALCDALTAVHNAGLVHRDVKAQNVMLADDGRVVLMDFGAGGDLRQVGLDIAGTPLYLAPEVARGAAASSQSDIYSLGVLLRYAATGAYSRDVVAAPKDKALKRLLDVVATACARDPRDRFASAETCGRALRDILVPSRMSPTLVVVAAALVISLGAAAGGLLWHRPGTNGGVTSASRLAARLTLRRLTDRRPEGVALYGKPTIDGRLLPLFDEKGRLVIANIDMSGRRPPIAFSAAAEGLAACSDTSLVSLSPSGDQAAFACELSEGVHELRVIRTDPAHPSPRRLATGQWNPLEWSHPAYILVESPTAPRQLGLVDVRTGTVRTIVALAAAVDAASLSPDAQWVVFDGPGVTRMHRHDVFVVSSRGGPPVPVAEGSPDDLLPAWTPDGGGVLFISDRTGSPGLWLQPVTAGKPYGAPQLLSQDLGRVMDIWTATRTGELIYFRQTGLTRTMTLALDASGRPVGEAAQIPTRQMGGTMMANWSSDAKRLAYQTTMTGSRSIALGVLDVTSAVEHIVSVPLRWFGYPHWSQDDRKVAVRATDLADRDGVFLVDVESGDVSPLKLSGPTKAASIQGFQMGRDNDVVVRLAQGFFSVDVPSGRQRPLFLFAGETNAFAVSPTDGSLAFVHAVERAGILKVRAPTGAIRELLRLGPNEGFGEVQWATDGRSVIFTRRPFSDKRDERWPSLWCIDLKTGSAQPFGIRLEGLRDLAVSPDGRHLSFTAGYPTREPWILENYLPTSRPAH